MFQNIYPLFEPKSLLKREMLENLRDYPRDLFQILYQDYSNGILTGCELVVRDERLFIRPGILYYNKIPYLLRKEWMLNLEAPGRLTYLKVKFPDKASGIGQEEYLSQIYLDENEPDLRCELELARFKLQQGSRLRDTYTDFFDYGTEFDTLNRIHAPYASPERSSISPVILRSYAEALMQYPLRNPWDYPFCINCMQMRQPMPYRAVSAYLDRRMGQNKRDYSNGEIYHLLRHILRETQGDDQSSGSVKTGERKLLLI